MATGFKVAQIGNYAVDVDDILIRREYFSDGTLWTWGYNPYGVLGNGIATPRSSPGTTAGGGTNWKQVTNGQTHTAAIKSDGTLWTCGYNGYGQLGDGTIAYKYSPVTVAGGGTNWKQVVCGYSYTAAIKTDGTLWAWGYNNYGQLGDYTTSNRSSPVTVSGGGTNWKQVSAGFQHTAAIKTDGTLWTWGMNNYGQLGDGTTNSRSNPATTVGGGTNWKQVACGQYYTTAIKTDGTLWTWGMNNYGQLGDNSGVGQQTSPATTAGGGTNWKQVSGGDGHTVAIKTDGTLWTWGFNDYGQLGDGTTTSRSSPGTVAGGGTNWKQVSAGISSHTAAIKTDGTLLTWGNGLNGGLGTNNTSSYSSPVTIVGGGTNWKQVSCGNYLTAAVTDLTI